MSKPEKASESELLLELKAIRKLLIASLLASGIDGKTLAEILGYKSASSITNEFPVRKLQRKGTHTIPKPRDTADDLVGRGEEIE